MEAGKRGNPFAPPNPYKFRLQMAWNYAYLAHQIQSFLKQKGAAPLHHPKSYIGLNFERKGMESTYF